MDIQKLYFDTLLRPASICGKIRALNLCRKNIVEAAVFVACVSTVLGAVMEKFIFGTKEQVSEVFANNSITFLFNPFSTFFFELLFIFVLIITILSFGSISKNKLDVEEVGKLVVWVCFVALSFKIVQLIVAAGSSNFYLIFRVLEMIWFVWALSSVVCVIYEFKSVILTAVTGLIVISFVMMVFLIVILSMVQSFIINGSMNV